MAKQIGLREAARQDAMAGRGKPRPYKGADIEKVRWRRDFEWT